MKRSLFHLPLVLLMVLSGLAAQAQKLNPFDTQHDAFIESLTSQMVASGKIDEETAAAWKLSWQSEASDLSTRDAFIQLINDMVLRKYGLTNEIYQLTDLFMTLVQGEGKIKVQPMDLLKTSQESLEILERLELKKFMSTLAEILPHGYLNELERFYWGVSQTEPRLLMASFTENGRPIKVPALYFSETDLRFKSQGDSTLIEKTSGYYRLLQKKFIAQGGKTTWEKVGLDPNNVFCHFHGFTIDMTRGQIQADTVEFQYRTLLDQPLLGSFEDRNQGIGDSSSARFPYFVSYTGGVVIDNLIPNVRYTGGFSLQGPNKIGSAYKVVKQPAIGDAEIASTADVGGLSPAKKLIKARLEIEREGKYVMKLEGESFLLDPEKLSSKNAASTIFITEIDSIFHPGLDLSYSVDKRLVVLKKPRKGPYSHIPFTSSYHDFYLYFETILWNIESDDIQFTALLDKENKTAAIESFDYFTAARYSQFKNILSFNPVGAIYRYALQNRDQPIFAENVLGSYPAEYRMTDQLSAFKQSLPLLEGSGFIKYDPNTLEIFPQEKLFKWTQAARGVKDFDAIQVISRVQKGDHARLDLKTTEINMRGVPYFSLSDSQFVRVKPLNDEVFVTKDRALRFGGDIAAGRINLYSRKAENFYFDYESFNIICDTVDSIRFELVRNPPPDYEYSALEKALGNTVFEKVSGAIHIDSPNNKSGKDKLPHFPVFDSYQNSYVYWAKPSIQGGVYTKDKLYFSIFPFVLDSLSNFDERGLLFEGEFFSSDIFPKIIDTLTVMPDFTLGFRVLTPDEGYDIYNYKGKYYEDIILDGSGLHGKGVIEHGGLVIASDSIVFHFDSVMSYVDKFTLDQGYRKGQYFPQLEGSHVTYTWYPNEDRVVFTTPPEPDSVSGAENMIPISVFDGEASFYGTLSISDEGLFGNGRLVIGQVEVSGDNILMRERDFEAENARFAIIDSIDPGLYYFVANNVDISYDVMRHSSNFTPKNPGEDLALFPQQNFFTSLNKGAYQRNAQLLSLEGAASKDKNFFLSIDARGDSLMFNAEKAQFDLAARNIDISGVPYVYVADAIITPRDLSLTIESTGALRSIESATIEASRETRDHRIYDANVQILSGTAFQGAGKYDYIEVNGKNQFIQFDEIRVNREKHTFAVGRISKVREFYLTDRILFHGKVQLDASQRFLQFEGEVKIESDNPVFKGSWFKFAQTVVNPDSVFVPISTRLTNAEGELLTVGLNYIPEIQAFYSNFLQPKEEPTDVDVLAASGGLTVDRNTKEFRIGPEEKIKNRTFKGATVSFDDTKNIITSKGYLQFPYRFRNKTISMKLIGAWSEFLEEQRISTDLLMAIDMSIIPAEQLTNVVTNFRFLTISNDDIDFQERGMLENIAELLDEGKRNDKETLKFVDQVNSSMIYTDIHLAEMLPHTILMSGVNFNYNEREGVLFSDSQVGLIGLNGQTINKKVKAKVLYKLGKESAKGDIMPDKLTIYLEVDEYNWVYFCYEEEIVKTYSSYEDDYNGPLRMEIEKRKSANGFRFELASDVEVQEFRKKIQSLK